MIDRFHEIVYDSLRDVRNIDDKVFISSLFIVAEDNYKAYAELLYGSVDKCIEILKEVYDHEVMDFNNYIRMENVNVKNGIELTKAELIKHDYKGFYKAVYNKDEFALAICDICNKSKNAYESKADLDVVIGEFLN